jgi:ATP-dependent DNA helicase RecQ
VLLEYFGDTHHGACGNCDNCLSPPQTWNATLAARQALSCVYRTGQRFGAGHVADVLRGAESERVTRCGHDQLSTYGIGKGHSRVMWTSICRQLVVEGLLTIDDATGGLRLTAEAGPVLRGERAVLLRRETPPREPREKASRQQRRSARSIPATELDDPADRALFDQLRDLRLELARQQDVPAYVIFHDVTLRALATARPRTLTDMAAVPGIGRSKLERYGQAVLTTIEATSGSV